MCFTQCSRVMSLCCGALVAMSHMFMQGLKAFNSSTSRLESVNNSLSPGAMHVLYATPKRHLEPSQPALNAGMHQHTRSGHVSKFLQIILQPILFICAVAFTSVGPAVSAAREQYQQPR